MRIASVADEAGEGYLPLLFVHVDEGSVARNFPSSNNERGPLNRRDGFGIPCPTFNTLPVDAHRACSSGNGGGDVGVSVGLRVCSRKLQLQCSHGHVRCRTDAPRGTAYK